jgi:hypothetical protein
MSIREAEEPKVYLAHNGHTMVAHSGYTNRRGKWVWVYFNAYCADDCAACKDGETPPDW